MNRTSIEWVKNPDGTQGYTWNPITGCLNGCEYCYARKLANTRLRERYLANRNVATGIIDDIYDWNQPIVDPFYPRFWPEKLVNGLPSGKPKGIFVCDMSDLFGRGIPYSWTWQVLRLIKFYPQHRFYLLTKQPQSLIKFSPYPDNCWVGVSATNFEQFGIGLMYLNEIRATVKYFSFEPLLHEIAPDKKYLGYNSELMGIDLKNAGINWLIIGAQTKPYKPPKVEWVEEIVEAADVAGVPVFLKDNLKPLLKQSGFNINAFWADKRDIAGFEPLHLELRQEMPEAVPACR